MKTAGIGYGMGRTNIDVTNRIRFGVISSHDVCQAWFDSAESQYGEPTCPKCGNEAIDNVKFSREHPDEPDYPSLYSHSCQEYVCPKCKVSLGSEDVFPEDPLGYTLDDGKYRAEDCLDSDIIITKSPYYTYGRFCSPCVPGAVSLPGDSDSYGPENSVKAYCFGHDWFESEIAPYPVFRVADDKRVIAKRETVACTYCNGLGYRSTITLAAVRQETVEETERQITSGNIYCQGFNAANHTFVCNCCNGTGTRETVTETVQQ